MDAISLRKKEPFADEFARAVVAGLSASEKHIPCHFLYDARGSELFEEITELDEYYPTRTEIGLLETYGANISKRAGAGCALVEFGSGSSRKTHILIDCLKDVTAYVPIDIADEALSEAADRVRERFPDLDVHPVHADFNHDIVLPDEIADARKFGFFPGSTIGNFSHGDAKQFLKEAASLLGRGSKFLVGVDLKKKRSTLLAAYNDTKGVTAEFNLNLLERINRELDGDIDLDKFAHEATYNEEAGRVEIFIVSLAKQKISAAGQIFLFAVGERIHTENSHKYSVEDFTHIAQQSGWESARVWRDAEELFSLHFLARK